MIDLMLSGAAALLLLTVGVIALWKQRAAAAVALFCAMSLLAGVEIFDQLSLQGYLDFSPFLRVSLYLESLLPGAFILVGIFYGRSRPFSALQKITTGIAVAVAMVPLVSLVMAGPDLTYAPDFPGERVLFLGKAGYWHYLVIMCLYIVSLVNIEATLTATRGLDRYRMKFEAIGIMGMLSVLIFYYSQGLLYRTINMNLVPVRSGVLIIAALVMGYSLLFRGSSRLIFVSRHILYRSVALLAVGIYLISLGLIGEGMRYFSVTFGKGLVTFLAFAGGIGVLAVLFSETIRRKAKVSISKHFFAHKHDYREEWIKFSNRLASCATLPDVQETVLAVYRDTFGLRGGALYLHRRDEKRYIRALEQAMPDSLYELPITEDLHSYFVKRERVLDLTDKEHGLSTSEREMYGRGGAWLIVPLVNSGRIEGLVSLQEQIVAERLTYDDYDLMKLLARQAAQAISNLRLSEELMEMRAITAVSRISAFVIHDLKNLTSGLSLVVENAGEHIGNPDFQRDAIITVKNTLYKMKNLMQRLRTIPEKTAIQTRVEDIDRLTRETVAELAGMSVGRRIVYNGNNGAPVFSRVDGEEIKKVIVNLVRNACEASGNQGTVTVTVETRRENGGVRLRVSDTGCGMTETFLKDHLFRPFSTTKKNGLGIGLYQCRQIIEAHGGEIAVTSGLNKGTVFTIQLPAAETTADTHG